MQSRLDKARQLRRALQMYVQSNVTEESQMMEVADLYPSWEELLASKKSYPAKTIFKWGTNADGETQLWSFIADYTPQEIYPPDVDISHYSKIGIGDDGIPVWSQPYGADDAYHLGDVVRHKDKIWECTQVDGAGNNTWEPGVFGWSERK